jgi:hypothetical protein
MDSIAIISNFYEGKYRLVSMGNGNQVSFPKKTQFYTLFYGYVVVICDTFLSTYI